MAKKNLIALGLLLGFASAALAQPAQTQKPPAKPAAEKPKPTIGGEPVEHIFGRGLVAAGNGQYTRAVEFFTSVIKVEPDNQPAYIQRGAAYFVLGQFSKAVADFSEALRLSPDDTSLYDNRGLSYLKLKDYDKALSDFDKVLRESPGALGLRRGGGAGRGLYGRALARIGIGDLAGGYADLELAKEQSPDTEKYFKELGFAAPPAKPAKLPALAGQNRVRFQEAIETTGNQPFYVLVTIVDDRSKAKSTGCVTGPALVTALQREQGIANDAAGIAKARKLALDNKAREYHFSKQPALDSVKIAYAQKDIAEAAKQLGMVEIHTYDGALPGYRLPVSTNIAIACAFVERGKPVRGEKQPTVLP